MTIVMILTSVSLNSFICLETHNNLLKDVGASIRVTGTIMSCFSGKKLASNEILVCLYIYSLTCLIHFRYLNTFQHCQQLKLQNVLSFYVFFLSKWQIGV